MGYVDGANQFAYVRNNPWTHFDPEGLMTESDYDRDKEHAKDTAANNIDAIHQKEENGEYGDPDSPEALAKEKALDREEIKQRDARIRKDEEGKANLEATAKWAREHNIKVNEDALDDDPSHSSSWGPTLENIFGMYAPEDQPSAGQVAYAAIRKQMTSGDLKEVLIMAETITVPGGAEEKGAEVTANAVRIFVRRTASEATEVAEAARMNETADEIISKELKGSVNREFPGQFRNKTLAEIKQAADDNVPGAKKAWKLLTNSEYKK
jgi:hypothetical protein